MLCAVPSVFSAGPAPGFLLTAKAPISLPTSCAPALPQQKQANLIPQSRGIIRGLQHLCQGLHRETSHPGAVCLATVRHALSLTSALLTHPLLSSSTFGTRIGTVLAVFGVRQSGTKFSTLTFSRHCSSCTRNSTWSRRLSSSPRFHCHVVAARPHPSRFDSDRRTPARPARRLTEIPASVEARSQPTPWSVPRRRVQTLSPTNPNQANIQPGAAAAVRQVPAINIQSSRRQNSPPSSG